MKLVSTLTIRDREAPSRVMFGPHETNLGIGRTFSPAHAAYYARRAHGGAGIIVLEEASVHESDWPYERAPLASSCGPSWASVTAAVRDAGPAIVLAAIGHSGGQGISHWSQRELWAPSSVPEVATREVPKIMEQADIDAVIAGFASATRLAVASGLDGVEVNAGQYSLVRQFLSGLTNMRADEYGNDKLKFAVDVLQAVRTAAGDKIVGLRLSVDELAPWAGIVPEAGVAIAVALAPFVDVITISRGSIYSAALTRPDGHVEPGFGIDHARQVRAALREAGSQVPVAAQGSIVDFGQAEWAIDSDASDLVEMTRALLADADLVSKVRAEQSARIRPCILCNQTCKVRDNRNPIITCVVDPRTGFELTDPPEPVHQLASNGRRVRVIGGGVAGLAAARLAALHGAEVELHERSSEPGGVVRIASLGAGRGRLRLLADWLAAECALLGVRMQTDSHIADETLDAGPENTVTIVATGGVPAAMPFTINDGAHVVWCAALLATGPGRFPEGRIAVWDPIGGPIAISIAEWLVAEHGREVVLITPDLLVGEKLALSGDLAPSQQRLHGAGIELVKRALVRQVTLNGVEVEDRFSGARTVVSATSLVACHHAVPDTAIDPDEQRLQAGDRVAPRSILEAIREGTTVGRQAAVG